MGDSAFLEIKQNYDNYSSISWNTPIGIITNTNKVNTPKSGKYFVKANSAYFAKTISDSCYVKVLVRPKFALADTLMCKNKTIQLNAKNEGMYHLWSTNEKSQIITVSQPGTYWVKISNGYCSITDSVKIKQISGSNLQLPKEVSFCLNEQLKNIEAKASPGTRFNWNTGATTATISINKEGVYWVISEFNNCGKQIDSITVSLKMCECEMMIPNSFTPNEDNKNDYFFPVMECEYSYFFMSITDRWGNNIYSTYQTTAKWDGRYKGNLCPEDIYLYRIESVEKGSEKKQVRNGHISLFR